MKYKNVITYGTFDLFHIGHLRLLNRISSYGENVIVGVSTDQFNSLKGKHSSVSYEERIEIVSAIKGVDLVIPEESWEQKINDIQKYQIDAFFIGDDWLHKFDYLSEYCEVIYLPRTKGISSTMIKENVKNTTSLILT